MFRRGNYAGPSFWPSHLDYRRNGGGSQGLFSNKKPHIRGLGRGIKPALITLAFEFWMERVGGRDGGIKIVP